jgi:hypothetical protein
MFPDTFADGLAGGAFPCALAERSALSRTAGNSTAEKHNASRFIRTRSPASGENDENIPSGL